MEEVRNKKSSRSRHFLLFKVFLRAVDKKMTMQDVCLYQGRWLDKVRKCSSETKPALEEIVAVAPFRHLPVQERTHSDVVSERSSSGASPSTFRRRGQT